MKWLMTNKFLRGLDAFDMFEKNLDTLRQRATDYLGSTEYLRKELNGKREKLVRAQKDIDKTLGTFKFDYFKTLKTQDDFDNIDPNSLLKDERTALTTLSNYKALMDKRLKIQTELLAIDQERLKNNLANPAEIERLKKGGLNADQIAKQSQETNDLISTVLKAQNITVDKLDEFTRGRTDLESSIDRMVKANAKPRFFYKKQEKFTATSVADMLNSQLDYINKSAETIKTKLNLSKDLRTYDDQEIKKSFRDYFKAMEDDDKTGKEIVHDFIKQANIYRGQIDNRKKLIDQYSKIKGHDIGFLKQVQESMANLRADYRKISDNRKALMLGLPGGEKASQLIGDTNALGLFWKNIKGENKYLAAGIANFLMDATDTNDAMNLIRAKGLEVVSIYDRFQSITQSKEFNAFPSYVRKMIKEKETAVAKLINMFSTSLTGDNDIEKLFERAVVAKSKPPGGGDPSKVVVDYAKEFETREKRLTDYFKIIATQYQGIDRIKRIFNVGLVKMDSRTMFEDFKTFFEKQKPGDIKPLYNQLQGFIDGLDIRTKDNLDFLTSNLDKIEKNLKDRFAAQIRNNRAQVAELNDVMGKLKTEFASSFSDIDPQDEIRLKNKNNFISSLRKLETFAQGISVDVSDIDFNKSIKKAESGKDILVKGLKQLKEGYYAFQLSVPKEIENLWDDTVKITNTIKQKQFDFAKKSGEFLFSDNIDENKRISDIFKRINDQGGNKDYIEYFSKQLRLFTDSNEFNPTKLRQAFENNSMYQDIDTAQGLMENFAKARQKGYEKIVSQFGKLYNARHAAIKKLDEMENEFDKRSTSPADSFKRFFSQIVDDINTIDMSMISKNPAMLKKQGEIKKGIDDYFQSVLPGDQYIQTHYRSMIAKLAKMIDVQGFNLSGYLDKLNENIFDQPERSGKKGSTSYLHNFFFDLLADMENHGLVLDEIKEVGSKVRSDRERIFYELKKDNETIADYAKDSTGETIKKKGFGSRFEGTFNAILNDLKQATESQKKQATEAGINSTRVFKMALFGGLAYGLSTVTANAATGGFDIGGPDMWGPMFAAMLPSVPLIKKYAQQAMKSIKDVFSKEQKSLVIDTEQFSSMDTGYKFGPLPYGEDFQKRIGLATTSIKEIREYTSQIQDVLKTPADHKGISSIIDKYISNDALNETEETLKTFSQNIKEDLDGIDKNLKKSALTEGINIEAESNLEYHLRSLRSNIKGFKDELPTAQDFVSLKSFDSLGLDFSDEDEQAVESFNKIKTIQSEIHDILNKPFDISNKDKFSSLIFDAMGELNTLEGLIDEKDKRLLSVSETIKNDIKAASQYGMPVIRLQFLKH